MKVAHYIPFLKQGGVQKVAVDLIRSGITEDPMAIMPGPGPLEEWLAPYPVHFLDERTDATIEALKDYDLLHIHACNDSSMRNGYKLAKDAGIGCIATLHLIETLDSCYRSLVICHRQAIADMQTLPTVVIPNAVPLPKGSFKPKELRPGDTLQLLVPNASRRYPDYIIRDTALLLLGSGIPFEIIKLGDRDGTLECIEGLVKCIRQVGWVSDPTPYYEEAHILFHPCGEASHDLVVLEAMAHGMPCVVSPARAAAVSVLNGLTGVVCQPTAEYYAASILHLYQQPNTVTRMSHNARTAAETINNHNVFLTRHLDAYLAAICLQWDPVSREPLY